MENKKLIKKFVKVYTEVERKCVHPDFMFPGGGKVEREMDTFLDLLIGEFGDISDRRIVDYCICLAHFWVGSKRQWRVNFSFGKKAIQRYVEYKNGKRYYEDQWLKSHGLSRTSLESLITDTSAHPLIKYMYVDAEEQTKKRAQNIGAYMVLCEKSTLLWSPYSAACRACKKESECMRITQSIYPELYRIRVEKYEQSKE